MANFSLAVSKLFRPGIEGRFSDHPADTGGPTYCGIARNHHPDWPGWATVDMIKKGGGNLNADPLFETLLPALLAFYKPKFWIPIQGDKIQDQGLADFLFACAVNMGIPQAIKLLQRAVGTSADGMIGLKTLAAANTPGVLGRYADQVRAFYEKLATKGQNHLFLKGWMNRVAMYVTEDGRAA